MKPIYMGREMTLSIPNSTRYARNAAAPRKHTVGSDRLGTGTPMGTSCPLTYIGDRPWTEANKSARLHADPYSVKSTHVDEGTDSTYISTHSPVTVTTRGKFNMKGYIEISS